MMPHKCKDKCKHVQNVIMYSIRLRSRTGHPIHNQVMCKRCDIIFTPMDMDATNPRCFCCNAQLSIKKAPYYDVWLNRQKIKQQVEATK